MKTFANKIFFDKDISIEPIKNKKIGIIGYGNQARAQALNLKDSKLKVQVGLRRGSKSLKLAKKDSMPSTSILEIFNNCDIICLLIPDNQIKNLIEKYRLYISNEHILLVSHGYTFVYEDTLVPDSDNVIMVAPSGGGHIVRSEFKKGFGVPALVACYQSEKHLPLALAYAKALGSSKAAVFKSTFKEETETDLFAEQVILTGSIPLLIIESFKVLLEEGYDPIVSWFVCFYETKTIIDLIFKKGLNDFYDSVSNTARYGGLSKGSYLIDKNFKTKIKKVIADIKSKSFHKELVSALKEDDGNQLKKKVLNSKDFNYLEKELLIKHLNSTD